MLSNRPAHSLPAARDLLRAHFKRSRLRLASAYSVRVYDQGVSQLLGCAGKANQDENATLIVVAGSGKFPGDRVRLLVRIVGLSNRSRFIGNLLM